MKNILLIFIASATIIACGDAKLSEKAEKLKKLKADYATMAKDIKELQAEVDKADTSKKIEKHPVQLTEVKFITFKSFIDIQGKIDAEQNVQVSPQMPGVLMTVNVRVGQSVSKGQTLAVLEGVKTLNKSLSTLNTNFTLIKTIFEKQKSLWDQGVGTEVAYLQAKTNKESLETQIATLNEQIQMCYIKSPISGVVDECDYKVGQAVSPGFPGMRVVNGSALKVVGDVAESYSSKVNNGGSVQILIPDANDSISTRITYASKVISAINRSFTIEAKIPSKAKYRPNMIAIIKIVDYVNAKAITVPVSTIQHTDNGDFVMVARNDKAYKAKVTLGTTYNGNTEIKDGLIEGDKLITEGFEDLNEGDVIEVGKF